MPLLSGADLGSPPLAEYLQDITEALAATTTPREVIEIVLTPAVQALEAVAGIVLLVDQTDQQLKLAGSQSYEDGTLTVWQEGPLEDHLLISDILRMREALYFEHAGALKEAYPDLESRTGALAAIANAALPMFLDGRPLGVIVLDFKEPHHFTPAERRFLKTLAAQCAVALGRGAGPWRWAVALGRAEASSMLEARVEEQTRQLTERTRQLEERTQQLEEQSRRSLEDARAQEAFVAFTEAAGTQTDLQALIRQAIKVLEHRFPGSSIGYYEEEDGLWKARVWSEDVLPELAAMIAAGLPAETPMFAHMLRTRQPVFTEAWDAVREQINLSEEYGAVANYPLVVNGELHWLLSIGLRGTRTWSEVDQALVRAVGRSLNLALDRAVQTRQLDEERAALEAFTRFTEEVGSETDVEVLVQRAITLLADTCSADTVYLKCDGDLFKATVWNSDFDPALLTRLQAGFPLKQSNLALILRQNTAAFIDHWDAAAQWIEESLHLRAVAGYPYFEEDQLESVLLIGCRTSAIWDERTKGIIRAVGHSLDLALDRAHQTEALKQKNAELAARTQALEGFALLTREFSLEHDPVTQVGRAQELILSLMPSGISTYYELQGDHWDLRSHRGTFHDPALLEALQAGVPRGSILNIERPAATGQPYYQDHFDASTSMVAQKEFEAIGTSVGLPILVTDQVQGVLIVGLYQARPWSAPERAVLETVAHSLGLVLERSLATRALLDQRDALDVQTASLAAANEELQAFSYSVSHDLRTPVRHMLGFLGLARKNLDGRLDERSARYLDVVEQAGTQMNTLIDALMDLSRAAQHTVRVQVVDLDELMAQIQAVLLPDLLSRNIQWEVAPLPSVWGDADALKQVLTQLTENAVKFTRTRDPAVIRVWAEDQGDAWGVFVQDNGLGFDPRYQDRLFNMFQRLHSVKEAAGTGVGLASVRRLILKHGGQVFATGQVGEGATFGFTLPKTTLAQP